MRFSPTPLWKEAPFLRLLIPFAGGIISQWYMQWDGFHIYFWLIVTLLGILLFNFIKINRQFINYWLYGFLLKYFLFVSGVLLIFLKDVSRHRASLLRIYNESHTIIAKLEEPLSPKLKSFKAIASVILKTKDSLLPVKGNIIMYIQKDSSLPRVEYGSYIIFKKHLQLIKNTGNPGSFDYKQYCLFKGIYYQVYLKSGEYKISSTKKINTFKKYLFDTRKKIITILCKYIPGVKESGVAEALLIGYKEDLDKNLVQAYTNTGVIHIIAISGLHVGLIYWILGYLLTPFMSREKSLWLKPVFIITGLWLFGFLAGGSPSVLRSVVMFTFIVLGESMAKRISVYNSLAASAFLLLCYNPYWLWDVGFQLSYAAVLSIIIFRKSIYNWWFIPNKTLDAIWKLITVTLAAQILTIPICFYYFHQFPNFFLITNLIAVPLSSIILLCELLLCSVFWLPALAKIIGWLVYWLIRLMNSFIEGINNFPFSLLENIRISILQLCCLYFIIICLSIWLLKLKQLAFIGALSGVIIFGLVRIHLEFVAFNQNKLIVYNIPSHQAIDFIEGKYYLFKGDSILLENDFLQNFHLKPSRIEQCLTRRDSLPNLFHKDFYYQFRNKSIIIIDDRLPEIIPTRRINVDIIIISKNPKIYIANVSKFFSCKKMIFDASNSPWKIVKWKTDCDQLNISCYSVSEKGAFVMNMN